MASCGFIGSRNDAVFRSKGDFAHKIALDGGLPKGLKDEAETIAAWLGWPLATFAAVIRAMLIMKELQK